MYKVQVHVYAICCDIWHQVTLQTSGPKRSQPKIRKTILVNLDFINLNILWIYSRFLMIAVIIYNYFGYLKYFYIFNFIYLMCSLCYVCLWYSFLYTYSIYSIYMYIIMRIDEEIWGTQITYGTQIKWCGSA